ncbi:MULTISPECIES: conjugal transfer protein TraD [unclassified Sphingomonas]|uniref:conjugal transfer protein TraD n=1 Tax=unclassified Sphingomonas TaxID=196159 RepID=UPI000ACDB083|nr:MULTISPECIES: conjugal transfer protein TraD [unclassified Sphingomonas]
MRKPRDYDAELKALDDKAKLLKTRKLQQLGELVIACGADALPVERLAGALLLAVDEQSQSAKEAQRARGAAFFQGAHGAGGRTGNHRGSAQADDRGAPPPASQAGAP